ncbi:class-II fumarase/aspartase family protein [Pseudonocardia endophytica]|uniref:3-carboxy-cis,cis-muconate cycloisomerase n=1 Tax=Pseudonocardia endophytica TaxID=401976 RepID=A0A4R1HYW8_PSEEN|nr:adenylosuccinate lyase family protein [Pseudonocardia endophytica]TCK26751.1 3-carboxy-cis,cis-muconate cycloisomerase [Pseudonocardia endophytica]
MDVGAPITQAPPFTLLTQLVGDPDQLEIFSERGAIESWLAVERALALAQAEHGILTDDEAVAIASAARYDNVDRARLWGSARNVGYPILGLVGEIGRSLGRHDAGRVHFGATTQDIMDSGLALQIVRSVGALDRDLGLLGDAVARRAVEHAHTVMPARTHGQQAVPTTFGATLGTLLAELTRHRARLAEGRARLSVVSLFGAGGTAAALGPRSREVRASVARLLRLRDPGVSWHVGRDVVAEFGWLCTTVTATCARFARNIVDLSRTEIGEVFEPYATHRGASSTMPQKANPISSEILIGLAGTAGSLASSLARIQEAGHERAAGEWQIEWQVLPQLAVLAGSALKEATTLADGMRVDARRMRANLDLDGGLVMAEAQMMRLADDIGHDVAHDLVYTAAHRARERGGGLADALYEAAGARGRPDLLRAPLPTPESHLGEAATAVRTAVDQWSRTPPGAPEPDPPVAGLATTGPRPPVPGAASPDPPHLRSESLVAQKHAASEIESRS